MTKEREWNVFFSWYVKSDSEIDLLLMKLPIFVQLMNIHQKISFTISNHDNRVSNLKTQLGTILLGDCWERKGFFYCSLAIYGFKGIPGFIEHDQFKFVNKLYDTSSD